MRKILFVLILLGFSFSGMMQTSAAPSLSPIFRFWSEPKQTHFYTIADLEKDNVMNNDPSWGYERVSYYAAKNTNCSGLSPLYRFWSQQKQSHFYTRFDWEKNNVITNDPSWSYEGQVFCVAAGPTDGAIPVYRFWSEAKQSHFYTIDAWEKNNVIANDPSWAYETIAFYAWTSGPAVTERFVLIGDTGSGNANQQAVANSIATYCNINPCNAVYLLGDIIYNTGVTSVDDPQFQTKFENVYSAINIPFYITFGNHDYIGCKSCYLDYASRSTKWRMPNYYYHNKYVTLNIFAIDTENYNSTQNTWLQTKLDQSQNKFSVVAGHRPIITYETAHYNEEWTGRLTLKNNICNRADVFAAGHSHMLEYIDTATSCGYRQVVSGAGGQTIRSAVPESLAEFDYAGFGFVALTSTPSNLKMEYFDTLGNVLYTQNIAN